jgi:hypothetical protein
MTEMTVPGGFADLPDQTAAIIAGMDAAAIEAQIEKALTPNRLGFYHCPWPCGNPDFAPPKWKTEAGFRGHLAKCPARPTVESVKAARLAVKTAARRHGGQSWADTAEAQA